MADEIQIGVDASQGIKALKDFRNAAQAAFSGIGQEGKAFEKSMGSVERSIASVAKAQAQARKAFDINARKQAEMAQFGLKQNSAGQFVNAKTGQFAQKAEADALRERLSYIDRVGEKEAALERMRGINAQNERARLLGNSRYNQQVDAEAYASKQKMLDQVFKATDRNVFTKLGASLNDFPPAKAIQGMRDMQERMEALGPSARYALYDVSQTATVAGTAMIAMGAASVAAAASHERAFANVARTTQTSAAGYAVLQRSLEEMAMSMPVAYKDLTEIASAAGQLGISSAGVAKFTEVVAKLTATTNLSADAAGVALSRFKTFFSETNQGPKYRVGDEAFVVDESKFTNLASSILKVGVNSIATETGIANVSTQISSMAKYAGFTADQVIGLSGALASVGVAPELARGITTRMFTIMGNAVSEGGVKLETFAKLAGTSASEFHDAWGSSDMGGMFVTMLQNLGHMQAQGGDANKVLQDLGVTAVRDRPVWLRLAEAAGETGEKATLLAQTMEDAREGWIAGIELQTQYSKISQTTSARMQVLAQTFEQFLASAGSSSNSALGDIASFLTDILKGFEQMTRTPVGQWFSKAGTAAMILVGAFTLLVGGTARAIGAVQGVGQALGNLSLVAPRAGKALSGVFTSLTAGMGILGVVAAIGGVVASMMALNSAAKDAAKGVRDVDSLVMAMKDDGAREGAIGITIYSKAVDGAAESSREAAKQAGRVTEALMGTELGAEVAERGLKRVAKGAKEMKYLYSTAADEVFKSQLLESESFGSLLKMDGIGRQALAKEGFNPVSIDWKKIREEAVKGEDDVMSALRESVKAQTRDDIFEPVYANVGRGGGGAQMANKAARAAEEWVGAAGDVFASTNGDIGETISKLEALGMVGDATFADLADGAGVMSEATQKMVDGMAAGLTSFTSYDTLIGLTQAMVDTSEGAAERYEKAWQDAYGGASFSLGDYLTNFRKAAGEQEKFNNGLQQLAAHGMDTRIISDLAAMGPKAAQLVSAMVDDMNNNAGAGLAEFEKLWGTTGYDSMVLMATQMQLGQAVVQGVMAKGGVEALAAFNRELASGVGVKEALGKLQLDVYGQPIKTKVGETTGGIASAKKAMQDMQDHATGRPISIPSKAGKRDTASMDTALNNYQGQANGKPTKVPVDAQQRGSIWGILGAMQGQANNNPIWVAVKSYDGGGYYKSGNRTAHALQPGGANGGAFAGGGYTGPGGKHKKAGFVHRGEFVMDAVSTRVLGTDFLYSLMRGARGERAVGGYANGGAPVNVGGGGVGNVVSLSAQDRELLRRAGDVSLYIGNEQVMRANQSAGSTDARRGRG